MQVLFTVLSREEQCKAKLAIDALSTKPQVLFTVLSREEKYKAKLAIDAVVQRLGDTIAAAVFEIIGEEPLCILCSQVAQA